MLEGHSAMIESHSAGGPKCMKATVLEGHCAMKGTQCHEVNSHVIRPLTEKSAEHRSQPALGQAQITELKKI